VTIREFIESRDEMEQLLREETFGTLGLTKDGMPYVVPLNYSYGDGTILFHCSPSGKKLDCIRANPQVCFSVGRQSGQVQRHAGGDPCHVDSESVICYGTARIPDDLIGSHPELLYPCGASRERRPKRRRAARG
jgi:nitroimidazol reductase NimA-like FMN-containing flavoprotein (pyridoxamine 5'-phosphate oxidase superfamily)